MGRFKLLFSLVLLASLSTAASGEKTYGIDPDHSSITLNTTHLGIGTVQGRFDSFSGSFIWEPEDLKASQVLVRIDAASINTNHTLRDQHLRSSDFLHTDRYPEITFTSSRVTRDNRDDLKIEGNLYLHGVVQPVTLRAKAQGSVIDEEGNERVGFFATTEIYGRDFGIVWNRIVGNNAKLIGEVIQIVLNVEGVAEKPEAD